MRSFLEMPSGFRSVLVVAALLACGACTALLDRSATQCATDSDCEHFGGHPYCQSGVCVPSGLGPANCFSGTPQQPSDFLNQCSDSQCLSFDDCSRLGECADASDFDGALPGPPDPEGGAATVAADAGDGGAPLPSCLDPSSGRTQAVYLTGSSNFPPLLAKLAPLIVAAGYTPVYQVTNSCTGVASILGSANFIADPAPGSSTQPAEYFQQDGTAVSCALGPGGAAVDVGESDIFSSTCAGYGPPGAGFAEYLGPIQAMVFVVPGASMQQAISAEAARAVFGMGGDDGVAKPWTNPDLYFVRNQNTGTQQMIGKAINVPPKGFWGIDRGSAAAVDSELRVIADPTLANEAIGIISADYYDADRANLNALAFEAEGQDCAYLPDSSAYKKDKQNVRDGHYPIWGPIHFFAAVSGGVPVSPAAEAFVNVVSVPNLAQQLLDAFIAASLVPTCAMLVERSAELGPLSTYTPPFGCSCYFQASLNGSPPSTCAPCKTANDCTDPSHPACNLGYCEVQ
jgi:ABC-type phosphate transport system substrate-binding protein